MKIAALISNFILLGIACYIFIDSYRIDEEELTYIAFFTFAAISNIIAINSQAMTWLNLLYKRRILEERKRIKELEGK